MQLGNRDGLRAVCATLLLGLSACASVKSVDDTKSPGDSMDHDPVLGSDAGTHLPPALDAGQPDEEDAGDEHPIVSDAGHSGQTGDAGSAHDAGNPFDAGMLEPDAGHPPMDAGHPPMDAGHPPHDAGHPPHDAGHPPHDAGHPPHDAGHPPHDAGHPPQDAGHPPHDAGHPPQDAGHPEQDAGTSPWPVIPCNPPKQKLTAVEQGLKVQYLAAQAANNEEILPYLEVFNGSTGDVPLSELTLRYWLIRDGGTMVAECDYAVLQCSQIKRTVGTACGRGADTYIEVGFVGGTLGKGKNTGDIQLRLHKSDWGAVDQSNDYSYDATRTSYGDYKRVTLYRKGTLIWGEEP